MRFRIDADAHVLETEESKGGNSWTAQESVTGTYPKRVPTKIICSNQERFWVKNGSSNLRWDTGPVLIFVLP